jgi:tetratricopeptide (TPR) repeat protein
MWRGMVFRDQGKYGEALEQAEIGVARSHEMQQHLLMTFTALALGHVQRNLLNFEAALAAHTEALAILEQEQYQAVLFSLKYAVFDALCADYAAMGNWEKAFYYAQKAVSPADEDLFLFAGLTRWYNLEALLRGGETGLAQAVFRRFKERTEATRRYRYIILRCQAALAQWENNHQQALDYLLEAEKIIEEFSLTGEGWLLDIEIARAAQACGNPAEAANRREQAARKTGLIASGLPEEARLLFTGRANQLLTGNPGF